MKKGTGAAMAVLAAMALLVGACGDDNSRDDSRAVAQEPPVTVVRAGEPDPVGTFDTQGAAAKKASQLSGFEVRELVGLPEGFVVTSFVVRPERMPSQPQHVDVYVQSQTGGLTVGQTVGNHAPDGAEELALPSSVDGEAYVDEATTPVYYLVTSDMTFTVALGNAGTLSEEQVIDIFAALA